MNNDGPDKTAAKTRLNCVLDNFCHIHWTHFSLHGLGCINLVIADTTLTHGFHITIFFNRNAFLQICMIVCSFRVFGYEPCREVSYASNKGTHQHAHTYRVVCRHFSPTC